MVKIIDWLFLTKLGYIVSSFLFAFCASIFLVEDIKHFIGSTIFGTLVLILFGIEYLIKENHWYKIKK